MTDAERAVKALGAVARKRYVAEQKADELKDQTFALIVQGYAAGVPKLTLANAAGMTRQTVYTVLLRAGAIS